jgi:hypothetical protein
VPSRAVVPLLRPALSLLSPSKLVKPIARASQTLLHLLTVEHKNGDLGAAVAAELAQVRQIFTKADEFYRYYQEALLNRERHRKELKPTQWIPISEH